jgi:hypothetical protein
MISLSSYQDSLLFPSKWYHNISMKKNCTGHERQARQTEKNDRQAGQAEENV